MAGYQDLTSIPYTVGTESLSRKLMKAARVNVAMNQFNGALTVDAPYMYPYMYPM